MTELRLSPDLALPLEAVSQTFAILAKRGSGKTYTAMVLVEELLAASLHTVVLDPVGVAWGLRSSADGDGPGSSITVLGGSHGDLPIAVTDGEAVADVVIDTGLSFVLDLSLFRKGEQTRFVTDFAERLYHRNRAPLHVVLDEADAFAPQRPIKGQERMLGAIEDLVRRGRARGIGVTLITQRPAVLHKDVLTQCEVLIALRLIAPQDREAIDAWIRVHGTPEQRAELMASLPSLPIGTAWIWSPGWLDLFQRVQIRARRTFDSSATPKVGQALVTPRVLADAIVPRSGAVVGMIDLEAIRRRLGEAGTPQPPPISIGTGRPEVDDLRGQVRALEGKLALHVKEVRRQATEIVTLRRGLEALGDLAGLLRREPISVSARLEQVVGQLRALPSLADDVVPAGNDIPALEGPADLPSAGSRVAGPTSTAGAPFPLQAIGPASTAVAGEDPLPPATASPAPNVNGRRELSRQARSPAPVTVVPGPSSVSGVEQRILDALATLEAFGDRAPIRAAAASLSGYRQSGTWNSAVSRLVLSGRLIFPGPGRLALTDEGRALASRRDVRTLAELHGLWRTLLKPLQLKLFDAVLSEYPNSIERSRLAFRLGYQESGTFNSALASLQTLGAVTYPRPGQVAASALLFPPGLTS